MVDESRGRVPRTPKLDRFTKYRPTGSWSPTGRPTVCPGCAADAARAVVAVDAAVIGAETARAAAVIQRDVRLKPAMGTLNPSPVIRGRSGFDGRSLRQHPAVTAELCAIAPLRQTDLSTGD
ncbi:hypothetical protein MRA01_24670 [Methylobacterium radiotolerans]|nr:hypothetical protein MRA01_24670 [Methylobacterium radiotolerans]